jgi:hypothetical protein
MSDNIFLIGTKEDYSVFEANPNNVDTLPIKNLPMSYFPFFFNNSEMSLEKLKKIVPLVENYSTTKDENLSVKYTIDTEKLFNLLTILEEQYQPFNNNNIYHIRVFISIIWVVIGFAILKCLNYYLKDKYTYFILFLILMLLVISTIWALVITTKSF